MSDAFLLATTAPRIRDFSEKLVVAHLVEKLLFIEPRHFITTFLGICRSTDFIRRFCLDEFVVPVNGVQCVRLHVHPVRPWRWRWLLSGVLCSVTRRKLSDVSLMLTVCIIGPTSKTLTKKKIWLTHVRNVGHRLPGYTTQHPREVIFIVAAMTTWNLICENDH
jgi:hypothetical protein